MADTFRQEYRKLTDAELQSMKTLKQMAQDMEDYLNEMNTPNMGREIALAKTKLEEAIMWAVKGLTK